MHIPTSCSTGSTSTKFHPRERRSLHARVFDQMRDDLDTIRDSQKDRENDSMKTSTLLLPGRATPTLTRSRFSPSESESESQSRSREQMEHHSEQADSEVVVFKRLLTDAFTEDLAQWSWAAFKFPKDSHKLRFEQSDTERELQIESLYSGFSQELVLVLLREEARKEHRQGEV
ncbi:hypothetical protein T439DRAFT_359391 [Meredithblackwellia eburnea MCA 4105]